MDDPNPKSDKKASTAGPESTEIPAKSSSSGPTPDADPQRLTADSSSVTVSPDCEMSDTSVSEPKTKPSHVPSTVGEADEPTRNPGGGPERAAKSLGPEVGKNVVVAVTTVVATAIVTAIAAWLTGFFTPEVIAPEISTVKEVDLLQADNWSEQTGLEIRDGSARLIKSTPMFPQIDLNSDSLHDVWARFSVQLEVDSRTFSWILRAKDSTDYDRFELDLPSEGDKKASLTRYVSRKSNEKKIDSQPLYRGNRNNRSLEEPIPNGYVIDVTLWAQKDRAKHCFHLRVSQITLKESVKLQKLLHVGVDSNAEQRVECGLSLGTGMVGFMTPASLILRPPFFIQALGVDGVPDWVQEEREKVVFNRGKSADQRVPLSGEPCRIFP